jgi:RsiW-degrading membrane proteinase PrsW (M82 family)
MTLLNVLIAITAGIAPMMVYALIVWWFDRYEKEPWPLLVGVFVWGAVPSILLALIAELLLDIPLHSLVGPGLAYNLLGSSLIAPLVEEFFKGLAVLAVFLLFYRQFDGVLDGIVYGSIVGFGFAAVENVLYLLSSLNKGGAGAMFVVIFLRAFLFGLNHAFFTSLTGIGFAVARTSRSWPVRLAAPVVGLALAVAAHALHNAGATFASVTWLGLLLSAASDGIGVVILLAIIVLATLQERGWIVQYLADEVTSGLITPGQYHVACSYLERVGHRTDALLKGDVDRFFRLGRFYQMMTLLAFRKYQLASFGDEGGNRAEVDRWRRQVAAMQPRL